MDNNLQSGGGRAALTGESLDYYEQITKLRKTHNELLEALKLLLKRHYKLNNKSVFSDEVEQMAEKAITNAEA